MLKIRITATALKIAGIIQ